MKINTQNFQEILDVFLESTNQKEKTISQILKEVIPKLDSKETFVDFGCGDGKITNEIGKHFKNTIGIEINEELTNKFRQNSNLKCLALYNEAIEEYQLNTQADLMLFSYVIGYVNKYKDSFENAKYKFQVINNHLNLLTPDGIAIIVDSTYNSKNYRELFEFMGVPIFDNLKIFENILKTKFKVSEKFFPVKVICDNLIDLVLCFRLITYDTGRTNSSKIEMYKEFGSRFKTKGKYVFEYESKLILIKK